MANKHIHRALKARATDMGWTHCVTPHECAANPRRQAAHGNIVRSDLCRCGAYRLTEINAGEVNYGPWFHGEILRAQ